MSEQRTKELSSLLYERDRVYIEAMPDADEREAALCAVTTYRRPDRLKRGAYPAAGCGNPRCFLLAHGSRSA
jgi:hypothetical protein